MTREEIIAAVQECAARLGRAPRSAEFHKHTQVTIHQVRRGFRTFTRLLAASGVDRKGQECPGAARAVFGLGESDPEAG